MSSFAEIFLEAAQPQRGPRRASGNKTVALIWSGKTPTGWKRFTVEVAVNGKPKNHPHTEFPVGHWELRRYEGSKLKYDRLPEMGIQDALLQRRQLEDKLIDNHEVLPGKEPGKPTLKNLCEDFMEIKRTEKLDTETVSGYQMLIDQFLALSQRRYPDLVTGLDVLQYCKKLTDPKPDGYGLSERTRSNKFVNLLTVLRYCGIDTNKLLTKKQRQDQSDYPDLKVEIYEEAELKCLWAACESVCDDYHSVVFYLLYRSGMREKEAIFLEWADVNFNSNLIHIRIKPHLNFMPKRKKERTIPMRNDLAAVLKKWRLMNPQTRFIVGNSNDKPSTHWLEELKIIARKAGLNCGVCETCIKKGECERWFLHKFRATFATERFEEGCSLLDVQAFLGHSSKGDMQATMRYLRKADDRRLQAKVNGGVR